MVRRLLKSSLYIGVFFVIIGYLFRVLHYAGGYEMYFLGSLLIVVGGGGLLLGSKPAKG